MEKKVLDAYVRYLKSIEDRDSNIGESYKAMREYINKNCDGKDRAAMLDVLVYETIKAVKGHGIKCVSRAGEGWDKLAVQQLYMKLNNLQNAWDDSSSEREQRVAILADQFFKFILSHKDKPWLQLYMYQCYSERDYGRWLKDPKYLSEELAYIQALMDGKTPETVDTSADDFDEEFGQFQTPVKPGEIKEREQEYIDRFHMQCLNAQSSDEVLQSKKDFISYMKTLHPNFPNERLVYIIPKCEAALSYADGLAIHLQEMEMGEASQGT